MSLQQFGLPSYAPPVGATWLRRIAPLLKMAPVSRERVIKSQTA